MYFCRDWLSAPEHDLILKTIGAAYCHSHEGLPVLNRDRPLLRLQNLAQLSFRPRYPLQNIAEMSATTFRIGNRSSGCGEPQFFRGRDRSWYPARHTEKAYRVDSSRSHDAQRGRARAAEPGRVDPEPESRFFHRRRTRPRVAADSRVRTQSGRHSRFVPVIITLICTTGNRH